MQSSLKKLMQSPKPIQDNFIPQPQSFLQCNMYRLILIIEDNQNLKRVIIKKQKLIIQLNKKIQTLENKLQSVKIAGNRNISSEFLREKLEEQIFRNNFMRGFLEDVRVKLKKISIKMQSSMNNMKKGLSESLKKSSQKSLVRSFDFYQKISENYEQFQEKLQADILNYINIVVQYAQKTELKIFQNLQIGNQKSKEIQKQKQILQLKKHEEQFQSEKVSNITQIDNRNQKQLKKRGFSSLKQTDIMPENYKQLSDSYKLTLLQFQKLKTNHAGCKQKIKLLQDLLKQAQSQKNAILSKISKSISTKDLLQLQNKEKTDIIKTVIFDREKIKQLQIKNKILQKTNQEEDDSKLEKYMTLLQSFRDLKKNKDKDNDKGFKSPKGSRSPKNV